MYIQVAQFSKTCPVAYIGKHLGEYKLFDADSADFADSADSLHRLDYKKPMVLLGSPRSVNDVHIPWIAHAHDVVKQGIAHGTPMLGICFGSQLIAHALGNTVSQVKQELGWHSVFDIGLRVNRMVFQWHGEGYRLPANTQPLFSGLGSEDCCQGFSYRKILATQFHFEVTEQEISLWARNDQQDRNLEKQIAADTSLYLASQRELSDALTLSWLKTAV